MVWRPIGSGRAQRPRAGDYPALFTKTVSAFLTLDKVRRHVPLCASSSANLVTGSGEAIPSGPIGHMGTKLDWVSREGPIAVPALHCRTPRDPRGRNPTR
jgi:hypothetical protein